MKHFSSYSLGLVCAFSLILSACSGDFEALQQANPEARDYSSTLAAEYLSFAESEKELRYWSHADIFARKGLDALDGKEVAPESVADWGVDAKEKEEIAQTRDLLLALTDEDAQRIVPQKAARARLLYDCWLVQAARDVKMGASYPCEVELFSVLQELKQTLSTLPNRTGV